MPNTSYKRVASSVVEMLEELRAQVIKRTVQLTAQDAAPSKKGKGRNKRRKSREDIWHRHRMRPSGVKKL